VAQAGVSSEGNESVKTSVNGEVCRTLTHGGGGGDAREKLERAKGFESWLNFLFISLIIWGLGLSRNPSHGVFRIKKHQPSSLLLPAVASFL